MKMTDTIIPQDLSDHDNLIFSYGRKKLVIKDLPTGEDCVDMKLVLDRTEKKENAVKGICVSLMVLAVCMAAFAMMACTKAFEGNERELFMRIVNICVLLLLFCGTIWVAARFQCSKALRDVLNQNDPMGSLRIKYLVNLDLRDEDGLDQARTRIYHLHETATRIHAMLKLQKEGRVTGIRMEVRPSRYGSVTITYDSTKENGDLHRENCIGIMMELMENTTIKTDIILMDFRDMTLRYGITEENQGRNDT